MLLEALRYPFAGERRIDAVLVGGGLHLAAVFLPAVPFVPVAGYLVRVLRHVATDESSGSRRALDEGPPDWRPVSPLFVEGLTAVGIAVIYLLVPIALLVGTLELANGGGVDPTATGGGILFYAGSTLVVAAALAAIYPLPAALVAYATDGLRAAFTPSRLWIAIRDAEYFVATLTVLAVLGVAGGIYAPLNRIALGFFVAFSVEVAAAVVVARAAS